MTLFKFEGFLTEVSVQGHLTKGQLSLDYLCGGEIYGDSPKQKPPQISDLQEISAEQSYGRLLQRGGFYAEIISGASGHFSNFFVSVNRSSIHLFALAVQSEPVHRHLPHPGKPTTPQRDFAESSSNIKSLRQKITQEITSRCQAACQTTPRWSALFSASFSARSGRVPDAASPACGRVRPAV